MIWAKKDGAGNIIKPGDVCVRAVRGKLDYIVFEKDVWGGETSKGEFGRFITSTGKSSIKYSNILFAFDPLSKRRPKTSVIKKYYEEK